MYQVMQAILEDRHDLTEMSLIFCNVTEEDILLRKELEGLIQSHPHRVKIHFVLDKPSAGWKGGSGFVTAEMIKKYMPAPAAGVRILRCGPPPMMGALKRALDGLGYSADQQFEF